MNRQYIIESGTTAGGHNYRIIRDTRQPSRPVYWIEYQSPNNGIYVSIGKRDTLDEAQAHISGINERQKKNNRQRNAYRENALEQLANQITGKMINAQALLYPDDDSPELIEAMETACHYLKQAQTNLNKAREELRAQDHTNWTAGEEPAK